MNDLSPEQIVKKAEEVRKMLDGEGLAAEFVAPRLWEDPRTIDGGYTSVPRIAFYEPDGTWAVEGHGVDPDIPVVDDPTQLARGIDP